MEIEKELTAQKRKKAIMSRNVIKENDIVDVKLEDIEIKSNLTLDDVQPGKKVALRKDIIPYRYENANDTLLNYFKRHKPLTILEFKEVENENLSYDVLYFKEAPNNPYLAKDFVPVK